MAARAVRWSCARCQVSVGRIDGERLPLPGAWARSEGLTYCLSCRRARAAEAAMLSAAETISPEARVRLRRNALIAFEIDRIPAAPDRVIAGACRTSPRAVAAVREELGLRRPAIEPSGPGAA